MTLEELKALIDQRINERLNHLLGEFELGEVDLFGEEESDARSWEQVQSDVERERRTPPPGARSSLDLLRDDRDR
jgi:hypothetical protein